MSEVKEWLAAMGIAGIERLSEVFEAQGFSSRKSLQYLDEADLDYMFLSPKKLRLAEKRGITQEQQQLKRTMFNGDKEINQTASPANGPTETPPTAVDSLLERRKMELVENVSFLEAQVSSAQEYLSQLRRENDSPQTVTRGRVCGHCHQSGHNKNKRRGVQCDSYKKCRIKDKHPEVAKSLSETQKTVETLKKNLQTAKQALEQFTLQMQRSRGSFFAVMRPRLKRLNPIKYLKRQDLDKDLMYLQRILKNKIQLESDDWRLPHLIEGSQRGVFSPLILNTASVSPVQPATYSTPPANSSAPDRVSLQVHAGSLGGAVEVSPATFIPEGVAASRDRRLFTPVHYRFHPCY